MYRFLIVIAVALISGCGSKASRSSGQQPTPVLTIITQPSNQSVPLGQMATFAVVANGTGLLTYQWSENGNPISGATNASYTTPEVTAEDNGETFAVTVSNGVHAAISSTASLAVGPRSPKPGDLRFQQVDAPSEADQSTGGGGSEGFNDNSGGWNENSTGSPLEIGWAACYPGLPNDCAWGTWSEPLPAGQTGLTFAFYGGDYSSLSSDLSQGVQMGPANSGSSNSVITSLDLEPANNAYGMAWMTTTQAGAFDMRREIVAPNAAQATVATDAMQSRVVTAVSFDANGQVNLLSYGWQGDTKTVYDTAVMSVAPQDVESAAISLAGEGYILTAFGGDLSNGFLLIGTRVHGDTLPRPILTFDQSSGGFSTPGEVAGYAPVAWLTWIEGNDSDYHATVYEK